ncbi:Retrotrans gag domain-containing protein [Abeliophyllum distichum]|uniref:Retrotrans gag domain-containing protein n=1 Tax=Abeliophyllum distichum TaxID=126358 RepID=A0ABD1V4I7_9LAMI
MKLGIDSRNCSENVQIMALKKGNRLNIFILGYFLSLNQQWTTLQTGSIANKNINEAWDLYELIANTQTMFSSDRTTPRKVAGIHEIDGLSATNAQLATLTKQVELLVRTQRQGVNAIQETIMCENCGANHSTSDCMLLASPEHVNFVQNNTH